MRVSNHFWQENMKVSKHALTIFFPFLVVIFQGPVCAENGIANDYINVQLRPNVSAAQEVINMKYLLTGGITPSFKPGKAAFRSLKTYGIRRLRLINIEWDTRAIWDDVDFRIISWSPKLKSELSLCKRYEWLPHIIIGQTVPGHPDGREVNGNNFDWNIYKQYLKLFFDYVTNDWGFENVSIEVGNEFDNPKANWPGRPFMRQHLDDAGYMGYLRLYREISKFIEEYQKKNTKVKIRLGGPALTQNSMNYKPGNPRNWYIRFINDVIRQNLLCDFISIHSYGGDSTLQQFSEWIGWLKQAMYKNKVDIPIWITEWGASAFFLKGEFANLSPIAGAFSLEFARQAVYLGISEAFFLAVRLHPDSGNNGPTWFDRDRKPTNALKAILPLLLSNGNGRRCQTDKVQTNCISFMQDDLLHIIIWRIPWKMYKVGEGPRYFSSDKKSVNLSIMNGSRQATPKLIRASVNGKAIENDSQLVIPMNGYAHYTYNIPK